MRTTLLCASLAVLGAACLRVDRAPPASETSAAADTAAPAAPAGTPAAAPTPPPSPAATKVAGVEGFLPPESVLHAPVQDIYFVSNINGGPPNEGHNRIIAPGRGPGAGQNRQ